MTGLQIIESVEVVVDQQGKPAAVQLDIKTWESLLDWLEDVEDRALLQEKLPRLHMGPEKAGALRWKDVRAEWLEEARYFPKIQELV